MKTMAQLPGGAEPSQEALAGSASPTALPAQSATKTRPAMARERNKNLGALSPALPQSSPSPPPACACHLLSQNRIFWSLWPLMMIWSPHTTSLQ